MTKTEPVAHDPSKPSSFASRRAERVEREATEGPPTKRVPRSLRAGDDADDISGVVIRRVQA